MSFDQHSTGVSIYRN